MDITQLLQLTIERNASDLHLITGYYPTLRINGELVQLKTFPIVDAQTATALFLQILAPEQKENILVNRELDFGYNFNSHRFRINLYHTRDGQAASFRLIPKTIRTIEELGMPSVLHQFSHLRQGFILVTGPTGEGKSTTLAAIINEINQTFARHILTIEDPIEFIYPPGQSIVSQRELGQDTHSWNISLRSALREDPDVVLIGEMRDYDTIQAALTVAETGHLVFSTVHTNSAPQTIDRIIDVFPPHQQQQVRVQLASVLKAVISQRLLPDITGKGRVVGYEVLLNNSAVSSIIRDGKTNLIDNVIQTSSEEDMIFFERSLFNLYTQGKISRETAYNYAIRPNEIKKMIE
jgi:twitching motility protein PilT